MASKKKLNTLKRVESICHHYGYDYTFDDSRNSFFVFPRKSEDVPVITEALLHDLDSLPDVFFVSITGCNVSDGFCALFLIG